MELITMINRLNELYHKAQSNELTEAELAERDELRRIYLASIRGQVKASLDRARIVGPGVDRR